MIYQYDYITILTSSKWGEIWSVWDDFYTIRKLSTRSITQYPPFKRTKKPKLCFFNINQRWYIKIKLGFSESKIQILIFGVGDLYGRSLDRNHTVYIESWTYSPSLGLTVRVSDLYLESESWNYSQSVGLISGRYSCSLTLGLIVGCYSCLLMLLVQSDSNLYSRG